MRWLWWRRRPDPVLTEDEACSANDVLERLTEVTDRLEAVADRIETEMNGD